MVQTWRSTNSADAVCDNCGSVYSVTIDRFPLRDYGSFPCEICGQPIREWNDTHVPSFTLKTTGKIPD